MTEVLHAAEVGEEHGAEGDGPDSPAPATSPQMHAKLDLLEAWMRKVGPVTPPEPVHRFTPGLYSRELTMQAGLLLNSKIHRTEHQYFVSRGVALVFEEGQGWHPVIAPYHGITRAGTRRTLLILEECTWTTFHAILDEEMGDLAKIEARIIEPHVALPFTDEDIALVEAEIERWQVARAGVNVDTLGESKGGTP